MENMLKIHCRKVINDVEVRDFTRSEQYICVCLFIVCVYGDVIKGNICMPISHA